MQAEFDADPTLDIQILGVNDVAYSSGNSTITANRNLPWLQNTAGEDVWNLWGVTYRDVWVVDENNVVVGIYNVTGNNLGVTANYNALKNLFLGAAAP